MLDRTGPQVVDLEEQRESEVRNTDVEGGVSDGWKHHMATCMLAVKVAGIAQHSNRIGLLQFWVIFISFSLSAAHVMKLLK